jgi:hypothetical protein
MGTTNEGATKSEWEVASDRALALDSRAAGEGLEELVSFQIDMAATLWGEGFRG